MVAYVYHRLLLFVIYYSGISNLPLLSSEMRSMSVHFGPQGPVVFLLMSAECGKRIRNILGLMEHCTGCYDPESDGKALHVKNCVVSDYIVHCQGRNYFTWHAAVSATSSGYDYLY